MDEVIFEAKHSTVVTPVQMLYSNTVNRQKNYLKQNFSGFFFFQTYGHKIIFVVVLIFKQTYFMRVENTILIIVFTFML